MKRGEGSAPGRVPEGVLDAGVVLVRIDSRRRSHAEVVRLFRRSESGAVRLSVSAVNLAEAFQHSREYAAATGLDLVSLLTAFRVAVHAPDAEVARRVAALAALPDSSLADRFAAATAEALGARLYTTDVALARALRKRRLPVTLF